MNSIEVKDVILDDFNNLIWPALKEEFSKQKLFWYERGYVTQCREIYLDYYIGDDHICLALEDFSYDNRRIIAMWFDLNRATYAVNMLVSQKHMTAVSVEHNYPITLDIEKLRNEFAESCQIQFWQLCEELGIVKERIAYVCRSEHDDFCKTNERHCTVIRTTTNETY